MITRFFLIPAVIFLFSTSVEARQEVVLTMPKAGTHYLKAIIKNITRSRVIEPTIPLTFSEQYKAFGADRATIVMGHCEPNIMNVLPKKERVLLLIRDPRDLALSAVDYIDNKGLAVWPGLDRAITRKCWDALSKSEKLSLILEKFYSGRKLSIAKAFETAVLLTQQKDCLVVKYEELSPEFNTMDELTSTLQNISHFFGEEMDASKAQLIVKNCFKNPACWSFNKGNAFRYKSEEPEILELLESSLSKYIDYFGYPIAK